MGRQTPSLHFEFSLYETDENLVQGKSDVCWFLLIKTLLIKNNKKREKALKNEAGGDEKHVVFFYLALKVRFKRKGTHEIQVHGQ